MADDDPTSATPSDPTVPLPSASSGAPPAAAAAPSSPPDTTRTWRHGQVAVVAILSLLLGGAGGALIYQLASTDGTVDADLASGPTTTITTEATTESDTTSTTAEPDPTSTSYDTSNRRNSGGQTVVGNGVYTASYQSNQDRVTDDFEVGDNWQIRWTVPTGTVTIDVYDARDTLVETIEADGQGERRVPIGGTYRVEIDTDDGRQYSVAITDGP